MAPTSKKRWLLGFAVYIGACVLIDLFPHFGPPFFRYTGSDPNVDVWNLGWPLATMIWDARSGLHVGPFAVVLYPVQLFAMAIGLGIFAWRSQLNAGRNTHFSG